VSKRLIILAALALSGCAASGSDGGRALSSVGSGQCFDGAAVNNFNVKDRRTLYVSSRQGYVYKLEAPADCFSQGTTGVTVSAFATPGPRICVGGQASVTSAGFRGGVADRCVASVSGPITDSQESGLRSRTG
jgi:hypothetical protein